MSTSNGELNTGERGDGSRCFFFFLLRKREIAREKRYSVRERYRDSKERREWEKRVTKERERQWEREIRETEVRSEKERKENEGERTQIGIQIDRYIHSETQGQSESNYFFHIILQSTFFLLC